MQQANLPVKSKTEAKQQQIHQFIAKSRAEDDIVLRDANNRHIMFVGRTRSGKSTAYEIMKSPYYFVSKGSIFSVTRDANICHFTMEYNEEGKKVNYNISIIDTPGLFEVKEEGEKIKSNKEIEDIIVKCMSSEITKIHAVVFVASFVAGINKDDILALKEFTNLFKGAEQNTWLLITRAETFEETDKQKLIKELNSHKELAELCRIVDNKILFIGAVEQQKIDKGHADEFEDTLVNVISLRKIIFNEIFKMEKPFDLNLLGQMDTIKEDIDNKLKEIENLEVTDSDSYGKMIDLCTKVAARKIVYKNKDRLNSVLAGAETKIEEYKAKLKESKNWID